MKINAVIENKDGGTLVLDFPRSIYDVYEKIQSVGIRKSPHQITLSDEEGNDVRVKLYSEDEVGKHLLLTLNEQNTLADANLLAFMVDNAKEDFRSKLEQKLLHNQYGSMQEVTDDIKKMLYESGPVKAVFYCPLVGEVTDDEGFSSPVDGRFLKSYVKEISTDSHYILSDKEYPVVFEYAGQEVATVHITVNDGKDIPNELIYGTIKGYKVNRETGDKISGALFGLFRADETSFTENNAFLTAESGEDGVFTFENVVYGSYTVRELRPAAGYLENETVYAVTVDKDGDVVEITVVNDLIPEIGTTATINDEKEVCATEVFTLTDTVEYKHLVPGKEYTLKGILMDKATGEPFLQNGEQITSEVTFVPEAPSGSVEVLFTFDAKRIKTDTSIVVFESLYSDSKELTVHADIEDEAQTVTVIVPEIKTEASTDGKKETTIGGEITIEDIVSYHNLTPGKEYVVKGTLMNKSTGKPVTVNDEPVTAETAFTPEARDGEVKVTFTFNSYVITETTDVVVFESLYREEIEIAVHADIEDEGQSVKVYVPEIKTTASINGKKEITTAGKVTIEDVVSYTNLIPGTEYTIRGTLMNKATGEVFTVNGETITAEVKFTPESRNGEVKVTFTFDAHDFTTSTKLVVFESLYREDVEITTHKDIEDKDQTVTITPPPDVPQTGDNSKLGIWIGLGGIALGGAVACIVLYFKKKEEDEK